MGKQEIPDWLLERYLLGELPEKKIREIHDRIQSDPELERRYDELRRSDEDILKSYTPEEMSPRIRMQYERESASRAGERRGSPKKMRILYPATALAAAVMIFLFLFPLRQAYFHSVREETMEITRLKGMESGLYVYRKKNSGVEILKDGSSAAAGDLLQMSYISTEDSYGVILSIDGRGTVTLHYPRNLGAEPKLKTNSKVILPYAYELDDAPDFERFFLILSPSIIDVKEVMHAAELLARSPGRSRKEKIQLDESVTQISVLIVKGK